MKTSTRFFFLLLVFCSASCVTKKNATAEPKIQKQLAVIDSLLRSPDFSLSLAKSQDTAYYIGIGQPIPPFLTAAEDTAVVRKRVKEEKIATNLAAFYALECGLGVLCDRSNKKPTEWLKTIVTEKADTGAVLLLNRFANATWKISQPFRGLERITRPVFSAASFLPPDEIEKDHSRIKSAAIKLLMALPDVKDSSMNTQMKKIRSLLHDRAYALEIAGFIDSTYYTSLHKPVQPFLAAGDDTATIGKPVKDQKIATNVAGFYAVECCTNYLVTTRNLLPSTILQSIADNSISKEDKDLFNRFANATWKTSQPFRALDRIERETFTPFYFLSAADIDKDWMQIQAAAKRLLKEL